MRSDKNAVRQSENEAKPPRRTRRDGFTLIELLTVISIIALLAAIGAGLAGVAIRKGREGRIKSERDKYVTAIESYRAEFHQYPPDNSRNGVNVNPAIHQLYYELVGTVASDQGRFYTTPDDGERLTAAEIAAAFSGAGGFVHSVVATPAVVQQKPKSFLGDLKQGQRQKVRLRGPNDIELLAVSAMEWPTKLQPAPVAFGGLLANPADPRMLRVNPWHYVSTKPTNNPASFDLWAIWPSGKIVNGTNEYRIFGNWKE